MAGRRIAAVLPLAIAGWLVSGQPAGAAGFGIFEQGSKAMGMAGAFTAQADDPSAMFHNPGGLAFMREQEFSAGTTLITIASSEFDGLPPFPGAGAHAEQESAVFTPSHFYWVQPLGEGWTFGLSFNSPFALATNWKDSDTFPGRFISRKAQLNSYDISPNLAWQVTDDFGVGVGAVARFSDVTLIQNGAAIDPFTFTAVDIATGKLTSDLENAFGFTFGMLHKVNGVFSWGLSYRSQVNMDYKGDATFTQIPTGNAELDAVVAASLPSGKVPISTEIDFPEMASLGLAFQLTRTVLAEVDANWTGWSSFDVLAVDFDTDAVDDIVRNEDWEDAYNYRLGINWKKSDRTEWRFGYVFDENPQPDKSVGPILPDSDRNGFTIGYGRTGDEVTWDLALMYLPFDKRTTTVSSDDFNGTYDTTAWLFGATFGWK